MWWPNRGRHSMRCTPMPQLGVHLGAPIPGVHLEHPLSPWPCLAVLGPRPQSLFWLCLPISEHGGTGLLGEVPAPTCPMPVCSEPKHSQGLPTHYVVCRAPAGAVWLTICDKLPEADFGGLCNLWFLHTQSEGGCMLQFPPPSMGPHVYWSVRDAYGANMPGHTGQCNWRNVTLLELT